MTKGRRITHREIKEIRQAQVAQQRSRCALCGLPVKVDDAVLDHCHTTGAVRATLHRSCNALLGKIENNYRRLGVSDKMLPAFLNGCAGYLQKHSVNRTGLIHPTHRTAEEKRLLKNERARKRRKLAKKATR
ncbi:MAG: exonuclease VII [Rhodobacteraceae bacterium]|nr:exonuclease VII [Paracoccaceae bacterium]